MSTLAAIVAHTCNTVLEVLAMAIRAEKETKGIQIEKEVKLSLCATELFPLVALIIQNRPGIKAFLQNTVG